MNLHGIVSGVVSAVNPLVSLVVRVSNGYTVSASKEQLPVYRTPGAFTATIATVSGVPILTVSAITAGYLAAKQTIAGTGVVSGILIAAQLTGTPGGIGTYSLDRDQVDVAAPTAMTSAQLVMGQVQPLTDKELEHLDGLNVQGYQRGIYINGALDGLVRSEKKGGDLIQTPDGRLWLVLVVLEQWPDWVKVAVVLQDQ